MQANLLFAGGSVVEFKGYQFVKAGEFRYGQKVVPFEKSGLNRAIIWAGGMAKLGKLLEAHIGKKVSRQMIGQWKYYGRIPHHAVMPVHLATGIPIEDLVRPFEPVEKSKA